MGNDVLPSWNDGAARRALVDFVTSVTEPGSAFVEPEARIAAFDNDGTLWCEKPSAIQAYFIARRLAEMAEAEPSLRRRQPWQSAYEHDYDWLNDVMTAHYAGDDTNVGTLLSGILAAFDGVSVEDFETRAGEFLRHGQHPTLGREYVKCAYAPMVELLGYLEAQGFSNYIASGGGRDFMRPISQDVYGVPRERVIGSTASLRYAPDDRGGTITHIAQADYLNDGPEKPVHIWSRVGRRPLLAAGNANGDIPMLEFATHDTTQSLRLLVLHDDEEREFDYTLGAEEALERAAAAGWLVVSMKNDWATVF